MCLRLPLLIITVMRRQHLCHSATMIQTNLPSEVRCRFPHKRSDEIETDANSQLFVAGSRQGWVSTSRAVYCNSAIMVLMRVLFPFCSPAEVAKHRQPTNTIPPPQLPHPLYRPLITECSGATSTSSWLWGWNRKVNSGSCRSCTACRRMTELVERMDL